MWLPGVSTACTKNNMECTGTTICNGAHFLYQGTSNEVGGLHNLETYLWVSFWVIHLITDQFYAGTLSHQEETILKK